jgi:Concanavalin A-like lectin/glucanases superfamily/FecR protein
MNLTDQEILELNQLCSAVVDERLDDAQRERLHQLLTASEDARQYYVRAMAQSASLHSYASEMLTEAPDAVRVHWLSWRATTLWLGALAAAAAVIVGVSHRPVAAPVQAAELSPKNEYVARITGSKQPRWVGGAALKPGDRVRKGQRLELGAGLAEITFDCGAQVLLEGPASLDINSAWDTTLRHGTLKANVPHEAIGFRISNPEVDVVDLGTEFTMATDATGAAEVFVLKGEVEAQPRDASDQDTVLLREKESRRFGDSGISNVSDSEQRFAALTQPLSLDRLIPRTNCIHWSFDEDEGGLVKADSAGTPLPAYNAQIVVSGPEDFHAVHTQGLHGHALKFDGNVFARASFPGLSNSSTHTVAFWVKVPEDAQLSDAYAMVAWGTMSQKLGFRPVHIGWNRNPSEGNVGALRTDFGGGCALGRTSLRDGRWHHITVVFMPGDNDEQTPVQVKQYVDGRLESGTTIPGKTHVMKTEDAAAVRDILWLGRRLVASSRRNDRSRFRGEIEELYIADRALAPQEIVELYKDNQPPESEFANTPEARTPTVASSAF